MNWPASAFRLTATLCFSAALLLTASCDDPNGIRVDPPGTAPITTDYSEFKAPVATILQDSIETLKADNFLVGRVRDASLGTTTARSFLNLQVNMPADSLPARLSGTVLDSTVMVMSFNQVYGSAAQPVRFSVFALPQKLDDRASYNANTVLPVGQPIGTNLTSLLTRTIQTRQRQRVTPNSTTDTTTRVVNATIDDRTVRLALSRPGQTPGFLGGVFSALQTEPFAQAQLDAVWKGVAVAPTDDFTGTVVGFNRSNNLRVVFYYHDASAPTRRRSYSVYFGSPPRSTSEEVNSINLNAPRYFTQLTTDLVAGPFARLTNPQAAVTSAEASGTAYAQEGVGFGTRLEIPAGLKALKDRQDIAINRAELIIPVRPFTNALFALPRRLYLYEANANNQVLQSLVNNFRTDRVVLGDSLSTITGQRTAAAARFYDLGSNNKYYSVLITNYVQNYIYSQTDATRPATLILSPTLRTLPTLTLNRAVLDADNITLRVYYSKLR